MKIRKLWLEVTDVLTTKNYIVFVAAFAFLFVLAALSTYTVTVDEYAVITDFGRPGVIRIEPGLYFKWPTPVSITNRIDKKMQSYQTPLVEYLTGDKKNLLVQAYVFWRVSDPLIFFQAIHNTESAKQKLDDIVCSLVASTLGEHDMDHIISTDLDKIQMSTILDRVTSDAGERIASYGISIDSVGFSRIALPDDNTRSVYRRMIAERSSIANEYRAQGRQQAAEIRASADRDRSDILAVAFRDAEIIRGEADAVAAEIYGDVYSQNPEFFTFLRTLETERRAMGENTTIIMSMDSDIFAPMHKNQTR
jgi:modulator of FtsH protease HflC